jgi:hypothetical protein
MRCIRVVNFGRLAKPRRLGNLKNDLLVFFPHADQKPACQKQSLPSPLRPGRLAQF